LLDSYDWGVAANSLTHPLLDPAALHALIPAIPVTDITNLLQGLRSAGHAYSEPGLTANPGRAFARTRVNPFPRSPQPSHIDDASHNPYYKPCPSPHHFEYDSSIRQQSAVERYLFLHPAEERIEWREVNGIADLPIRWQGCSPGCLNFLEKDDEEDWTFDEEY